MAGFDDLAAQRAESQAGERHQAAKEHGAMLFGGMSARTHALHAGHSAMERREATDIA